MVNPHLKKRLRLAENQQKNKMEKVLSYEEYVRVRNLLTKIKGQVHLIEDLKDDVYKTVDEINEILNIKDVN